jgi:DNA modification methylase
MKIAYETKDGIFYEGELERTLNSPEFLQYKGKFNLIFFSPPFPLNRKKKYGNYQGEEYIEWLSNLGTLLKDYLAPDGSIVLEVGNSWEEGRPIMSTLPLRSLLAFADKGNYNLCQQFIWYNKAKLPSPIEWVNKRRVRVKDSFTSIWWLSNTDNPKANNKNVLQEYSNRMKKLLNEQNYNSGRRPSEHVINDKSFLTNNGGAIPSNVLISSNTDSNSNYLNYCKKLGIIPHPARMPLDLPEFFIRFLTDEGDIVFDPFGGSNTTGEAAQILKRKWVSLEINPEYIAGSKGRFENILINETEEIK